MHIKLTDDEGKVSEVSTTLNDSTGVDPALWEEAVSWISDRSVRN